MPDPFRCRKIGRRLALSDQSNLTSGQNADVTGSTTVGPHTKGVYPLDLQHIYGIVEVVADSEFAYRYFGLQSVFNTVEALYEYRHLAGKKKYGIDSIFPVCQCIMKQNLLFQIRI
jgi:hypothetical protein